MTKAIEISTRRFEAAHGRKPAGRGAWAFEIVDASCGETVETVFAPVMTYGKAKTWMKSHIRSNWADELATGALEVFAAP